MLTGETKVLGQQPALKVQCGPP